MPEVPYLNRELDVKFDNLGLLIKEKHDDVMTAVGQVRVQTTQTNGRVRWLEKMIWLACGGLGVISVLIIPLILTYFQNKI